MLQYVVGGNNSLDIIDTAKTALRNNCKWLRLDLSEVSKVEQEQLVVAIAKSCKMFDAILTIENDVEGAKQLKVDGVHISQPSTSPVDARKALGEEPIMGITIKDASEVLFVSRSAVDYIEVDKSVADITVLKEVVQQMKATGRDEPVVAKLNRVPHMSMLRSLGVDGISIDNTDASPVELKDLISKLELLNEERLNSL